MSGMSGNTVTWKDWVTALRSGNYKQGKGYLRSHRGFCCWGVACDVVDPSKWDGDEDGVMSYGRYEGVPPEFVINILGVGDLDICGLSARNDLGETFLDIADYIEKEMTSGTE